MCKAVQELKEAGRMEGRMEGEIEALIKQVSKKLKLGKDLSTIASDLDDTIENLKPIYNVVMECGVEETSENIYKVWAKNRDKDITTN